MIAPLLSVALFLLGCGRHDWVDPATSVLDGWLQRVAFSIDPPPSWWGRRRR